jgi:hypothetical protein
MEHKIENRENEKEQLRRLINILTDDDAGEILMLLHQWRQGEAI